MGKTDVQERDQKRRMSQKMDNTHKKREKKTERMDEHGKTYKFEKMSNQKLKSLWKCRSVKYVFLIDRDNKKRKKRQQMNKSMNKRRT